MHAIELLLDDHESFVGLFDRVRSGPDGVSLFAQIKAAIELHKHLEEDLFFPKLIDEGDAELKDVVHAAIDEYQQISSELAELEGLTGDREQFMPKLNVVMEDVQTQAEEEELRLFPLVEQQFDDDTLEQLGSAMEAEKARWQNKNLNV